MATAPKIVIVLEGGLVRDVFSSVPGLEVAIVDWDIADDEPAEHVRQLVEDQVLIPVDLDLAHPPLTDDYWAVNRAQYPYEAY